MTPHADPSRTGSAAERPANEGVPATPPNDADPDRADIDARFTYHPPKPGQPERYVAIRGAAKELAYMIVDLCPRSRERSLALTKLEEAVMQANAAIARRE